MDTSLDAERMQIELWRRMSPFRKARAVAELSQSVRKLSLAGIRQRYPEASEDECRFRFAVQTLGRSVACRIYPDASLLSTR